MHPGRIIILGFIFWILLFADKFLFLGVLGLSAAWQAWAYYILILLFARILTKYMGVINYLEAIFAVLSWLLMILLLDSWIAKRFLPAELFRSAAYWWSYFALFIGVFFLHRKRHIHVRKLLKHSHGHH